MTEKLHSKWFQLLAVVFGGFMYALGMNLFIAPLNLFSGGGVGAAQLITLFIENYMDTKNVNLYGIVYALINLPLYFMAWKSMGRRFFLKTLLGSGSISVFITLIPMVKEPIINDMLASVLIGGIITGVGVGIVLMAGGCGGGIDIVGVWAAKKYKDASVGKISLVFNTVLYAILLLLFDVEIVIYSLIYNVFFTIAVDKAHYQNITVRLMIFTKQKGIDKKINEQTGRGVTEWTGVGAYTGEETQVLVSCINKFEVREFMEIIYSIDPNAFIISDENVSISGNFEKRI